MTDTDTAKTTKKDSKTAAGGHDVKIGIETDDNGESHLVVSCANCEYAQTVPAGLDKNGERHETGDAEAQRMSRNHVML